MVLHHSDPNVDVTTSVRHHPIESLLATGFYWLAVLVLDIPVSVVRTHGLAVFAAAAVTHGNTRLPEWPERLLQPVVITLDLHLVHHSIWYDEANANFGAVLSVWDRLFGTYLRLPRAQQDRIVFGVRELPRGECLKPSQMLLTRGGSLASLGPRAAARQRFLLRLAIAGPDTAIRMDPGSKLISASLSLLSSATTSPRKRGEGERSWR